MDRELLQRAEEAARASMQTQPILAKHSGFFVGAAIRTSTGDIITGVNVESDSYGLSICAERLALFKALSQGYRRFTAIALAAFDRNGNPAHPPAVPCGACKQLLSEYAGGARVILADGTVLTVEQLDPHPFKLR